MALRGLVLGIIFCVVQGSCPNQCSGHGECSVFSRCACWGHFTGADCSEQLCPVGTAWSDMASGVDLAHQNAECSNRGICNRRTGACECQKGFEGNACQRMECHSDCNKRGRCLTMHELAATHRHSWDSEKYIYESSWDANMIRGCTCDDPYSGFDCNERQCPSGDDPMTKGQANEIQYFICSATSGSLTFYFNGAPTGTMSHAASTAYVKAAFEKHENIHSVNVTFHPSKGATVCQQNPTNVVRIEFLQDFGPLPKLLPYISGLSDGANVAVSADGFTALADSDGKKYTSAKGGKENLPCSGRGMCAPTPYSTALDGECDCFDYFESSDGFGGVGLRGDCGSKSTSPEPLACPGNGVCSGHGVCNQTTYTCACSTGYTGGDCSDRTCPKAPAWFVYPSADETHDRSLLLECAGAGECDRYTGLCFCAAWATGAACNHMACGGSYDSHTCSGHGQCLNMGQLALRSYKDSDSSTDSFTYGLDANVASTWDSEVIFGCLCDDGWQGYDCSEKSCPRGDDPGTWDQENELQLVRCEAEGGHFTLTFRQTTTDFIDYNATAREVETALESLDEIDNVDVSFSLGDSACFGGFDSCNMISIQFHTEHGNVPALIGDGTGLKDRMMGGATNLSVYTDGQAAPTSCGTMVSVKGTTEDDECSSRGLCDRHTGTCSCFQGYGASDGRGNPGQYADCGHVLGSENVPGHTRSTTTPSTVCTPGKFAYTHTGATKCLHCGPGTYSEAGAKSCTECAEGTFQPSKTQQECLACPAGFYCGEEGLPSTSGLCSPGKYSLSGASMCTDCSAGFYNVEAKSASCASCPASRYQPTIGQTSCTDCPPGYYCPTNGTSTPYTCPSCTYATGNNTICSDCPTGTCSAEGSTSESFCYYPSPLPSLTPSPLPTTSPTPLPSPLPTRPSAVPTMAPSPSPSPRPTLPPSSTPSLLPSIVPTPMPSQGPSNLPTPQPTVIPSPLPTLKPTPAPSPLPTPKPSSAPSTIPSLKPTPAPSPLPTSKPTPAPSTLPTSKPTPAPSPIPTQTPTPAPSTPPSLKPTSAPSTIPSLKPTPAPSPLPNPKPTPAPSPLPTSKPTSAPSPF